MSTCANEYENYKFKSIFYNDLVEKKGRAKMKFHTIDEALIDLQAGKPIIVVDDENRENEGDFVALAEKTTPEVINFMIKYGKGLVCTPVTESLATRLDLHMMTHDNTDPLATAFTVSIDHKDTTTGISAHERAQTVQALLDEDVIAEDFNRPGHIFPLIAKDGGVIERPGHTEAAIDLARLSGVAPVGVICEIINDDGTMARVPQLMEMAEKFDLKLITIEDLIAYRKANELHIEREIKTTLPTSFGEFTVYGYSNNLDDYEHIALVKGEVRGDEPVLVRVHSECLTGDVFHSYRCDCGPQLHEALRQINEAERGVLLYMRQEGRGIGLINKLRAYALQDDGFDTVEANEKLGFAADAREYYISAQMLKDLGVHSVKLLTNNPRKVSSLQTNQIEVVERIPLQMKPREENEQYLQTKSDKLGHLFTIS